MPAKPTVATILLAWYDRHARILPWRLARGTTPDPYRVWLSEVMLQQTTTAAVAPFYQKFLSRWPRVADLAAASEAEVMSAWAGLGYYSRARNLHATAKRLASEGFPVDEAGWRALPGVGAYTAAAIASIAVGQRAVVVDVNVERVVARLFAVATPLPRGRPELRRLADALTPDVRPGDYAQAVMDLGATVCTPRSPRCLLCPLREECDAFASGNPAAFPVKAPKQPKPRRLWIAWWHERDGCVLLVRRPPSGLLGAMRALPVQEAPAAGPCRATVTHGFTHFDLTLDICDGDGQPPEGEWWPLDRIDEAGLPTLFKNAVTAARGVMHARHAA